MTPTNQPTISFTSEEIEKLRQVVIDHDAKNKPKDIDLSQPQPNKPEWRPNTQFPKMVYNHAKAEAEHDVAKPTKDGVHMIHVPAKLGQKIVHNQKELDAALKAGFQLKPPTFEVEAIVDPEEQDNSDIESEAESLGAGSVTFTKALVEMTKKELFEAAESLHLEVSKDTTKAQLIEMIEELQTQPAAQ